MENKSRIKIGIYGIGILMMGVIGISGALTAIGAHFPDASQTMIQNLISIPCLVVIHRHSVLSYRRISAGADVFSDCNSGTPRYLRYRYRYRTVRVFRSGSGKF